MQDLEEQLRAKKRRNETEALELIGVKGATGPKQKGIGDKINAKVITKTK